MKTKALNLFKSVSLVLSSFIAVFSLMMFTTLGFVDLYAGETMSTIVIGYFTVFLFTASISVILLKNELSKDA